MKVIEIFTELKPEHYDGNPSITIRCKPSERATVEHDIMILLCDNSMTDQFEYIVADNR